MILLSAYWKKRPVWSTFSINSRISKEKREVSLFFRENLLQ